METEEAYTLLIEEASEVIHIVSKIERFGLLSYHPEDIDKVLNRTLLHSELGDFLAVLQILLDNDIVNKEYLEYYTKLKYEKLTNEKS